MKVTANEDTSYTVEFDDEDLPKLKHMDYDYIRRVSFNVLEGDNGRMKWAWFYGDTALRLVLEMLRFRGIH